jgi:hypothetical protein
MDATFYFYFLWKMYKKKCIPYLTGKTVQQKKKKKRHYGFKTYPYPNILIPLANGTIHVSILK